MSAPVIDLGAVQYVECIDCHGTGVRPTGRVEVETGRDTTTTCSSCDGDCTVDPAWVEWCTECPGLFWAGDGCSHGEGLCSEHRPLCRDCRDDRAEDAGLDAHREFVTLGGPR